MQILLNFEITIMSVFDALTLAGKSFILQSFLPVCPRRSSRDVFKDGKSQMKNISDVQMFERKE